MPDPIPSRPSHRRAWASAALLAMLAVWGCSDAPTAPAPGAEPDAEVDLPDAESVQAQDGPGIYSERTRVFEPERYELVSSADELEAGVYRYRSRDGAPLPDVVRNDFLVGATAGAADPFVRLALRSENVGEELVVETGGARWSDVIQDGVYGVRIPLGEGEARTLSGIPLQPVTIGLEPITVGPVTGLGFGPLEAPLPDVDLCALMTELVGTILSDPEVCGKPRSIDLNVGVGINIEGTLDSLVIYDGKIGLEGDTDVSINVRGGGITGGIPPVFAPCDRRAYLGCISTPNGADLIDFLRTFAPEIPDLALPAVRVCIPGTPVRVRAGRWDWSGFFPVWIPPEFERCRVVPGSWELPDVVLPTVQTADNTVRPHLSGEVLIRVKGDGKIGVKIPIPSLGAAAGYGGGHLAAKATVGIFIKLSVALKNGGGTVKLTFDEKGEIIQTWVPDDGWGGGYEKIDRSVNAQLVYFDNPDSMVIRAGALAAVGVELCAAVVSCDSGTFYDTPAGFYVQPGAALPAPPEPALRAEADSSGGFDLDIKLGAGAEFFYGGEIVWTRPQVDPDDPLIDNHHFDVDWIAELGLKAGIEVTLFDWDVIPGDLEWDETFELSRFPMMDFYGTGTLRVVTTTTGAAPDPDGYEVLVSRYDTLPVIIDAGAERLGTARDWGGILTRSISETDSVEFSQAGPCGVYYTDALLYLSGGLVVQGLAGATAVGDLIPKWAVTSKCDLLIARYNVELTGVAANCSVVDGAKKDDVWLLQVNHSLNRPTDLQRVEFTIDCPPGEGLGDVEVQTTTTGRPPDDGYRITVDGVPGAPIGATETRLLTALSVGTHDIGLSGVPAECSAAPTTTQVTVDESTPAPAAFTITCPVAGGDPGDVTLTSTTTGPGDDGNGFEVRVDGVAQAPLPLNGAAYLEDFQASVPTVVQVSSLAANCRASSPNPTVVTLDAAATPVTIPFTADCTTSAVDTLDGSVEATGWPTPSVAVRLPDGQRFDLRGPVLDEVAQLTGTGVRVWGVLSGTTLELYGYDLDSTLRDPSWSGIVAERGGEYWLFGHEAVRLVEVPPSLAARVGDLVWVIGAETDAGVHPFVHGVLREN